MDFPPWQPATSLFLFVTLIICFVVNKFLSLPPSQLLPKLHVYRHTEVTLSFALAPPGRPALRTLYTNPINHTPRFRWGGAWEGLALQTRGHGQRMATICLNTF